MVGFRRVGGRGTQCVDEVRQQVRTYISKLFVHRLSKARTETRSPVITLSRLRQTEGVTLGPRGRG